MERDEIVEILKTVQDPELGIDVWTLGLIRKIEIDDKVSITMTFTSPLCPYGEVLMDEIKDKVSAKGLQVELELSFDQPWSPSEALKEVLGVGLWGVFK